MERHLGTRDERAHPRSRGENSKLQAALNEGRGSSPLTRGKRHTDRHADRTSGLIPAHAGKTPTGSGAPSTPRAHPRSRGENSCRPDSWHIRGGSSPLTRGKLSQPGSGWVSRGLIPAHAGKTRRPRVGSPARWAHPRSRGENVRVNGDHRGAGGSSPLTRGKPVHVSGVCGARGLIPAHAGKTHSRSQRSARRRAHPRSRGENIITAVIGVLSQGSSPLTRGKREVLARTETMTGLIPAHAGKTSRGGNSWRSSWAHPRSRGEN